MRLRTAVLTTASLLALAVAVPAYAQTATPASPDPTNNPATADAQAKSDDAASEVGAVAGDELVVTGIRKSLQSSAAIKRNSIQQVDSIVAEDIGKLPDIAVSDTAARISGVLVDRGGGEASRVLVRGLPDFSTTYNGREIFTAQARSVALQDFASGAVSAVEVFKTTTAEMVEGGIAGEINIRSRRPFDFDGFKIAGSVWGIYETRSDNHDPNGNILITDRWNTSIGEIGALAIFSYTKLRYLDSTRSNTDFIAGNVGGTGYNFPDIQRVDFGQGDRTRPSFNTAIQWRPTAGLEFYAEGLYQGFRNKVSDRETSVPLWGGQNYSNIVPSSDGSGRIDSVDVTNPFRPDGFQGATLGKTNTYQYAVGGKYDTGPFHVSADLAHTRSKFTDSVYSLDFAYAHPVTVRANTGVSGIDDGPGITFLDGTNPESPDTYVYRGFFDRQLIASGRDWQGRVDVSYDLNTPVISKLEGGFRYVDRDAHFEDGSRYNSFDGQGRPLLPFLDYEVSPSGFSDNDPSQLQGWYTATYKSIRDNVIQLREYNGFAQGAPPADPSVTYDANERSWAGYGQVRYNLGPDNGLHVDGVLGLRVVKTSLDIIGTNRLHHAGAPDTFVPAEFTNDYTDWLPNASARLHLTDELQLRLSYTKTRSRPGFDQYNPGFTVDPEQSGNAPRNANGGNPNLVPLKSNNYDVSLEYYFTKTGSAFLAVFRRDLDGFISNYTQLVQDPTFGPIYLNQPYNTGAGRIDGVEAGFTTFFDAAFIPTIFHSFGVETNLTYLNAKIGVPLSLGSAIDQATIPGVSKWAYNISGYYEHGGFSARLSWNHRSAFPSTVQIRGADNYLETTQGIGRLDFSSSYDVTKSLTLFVDATNILGKPYVSDLAYNYGNGTSATYPRAVRYEESVYSLGARFRF